jgi:23S rRNA pseudouridine1911/1915/1917 synthase
VIPNEGLVYHARVRPGEAGETLLDYHVRRFRHTGAREWRRRLAEGRIRLNGCTARGDELLEVGDALEFHRAGWVEPEVPETFEVVFEDEDLLVVDKPAGLQVLPGGPFHATTLMALVRASRPDRASCAPAHRLGRGTSGLQLFGKSARGRAGLAEAFRARRVRKTYLAWVAGTRLPTSTRITDPIGSCDHGPTTVARVDPAGKPSLTRVRVLRREPAGERSLVAAQPITGRPNQIRVHAAAAGAPLVGDPLYRPGGRPDGDATPGAGGYLLHAASLALRHPGHGHWLRLRSRPPWLERESGAS